MTMVKRGLEEQVILFIYYLIILVTHRHIGHLSLISISNKSLQI